MIALYILCRYAFYIFHGFCTLYIPDSTLYMTKMYLTYERQYFVNFSNN